MLVKTCLRLLVSGISNDGGNGVTPDTLIESDNRAGSDHGYDIPNEDSTDKLTSAELAPPIVCVVLMTILLKEAKWPYLWLLPT